MVLKSTVALLFAASLAMVRAQLEESNIDGPCPAVTGTMHLQGKKLDLERIEGLWKVVYDD